MAHVLNETKIADKLNEERAFLHRDINARLWNESTHFYHDQDAGGEFSAQKSIGAYWGLLDKDLVPEERIVPFLRHLRAVECFNRPHRVPSLSADSDGYNATNGLYWRGGVWAPTNYMVLKGVRRVRHFQLAHDIAVNHLENVSDVFQHSDTFWENYAPEQPAPSEPSKPDFVGWTGLSPIAILIEDVIGLSIDWPLRRVTWDRRLNSEEAYGVRNLPLGQDGHMEITGNKATVEVTSNVPFSLTVRDQDAVFQAAIAAGHTTINLT
jgi:glycogen debranching enzyme